MNFRSSFSECLLLSVIYLCTILLSSFLSCSAGDRLNASTLGSFLSDDQKSTLISPGRMFELGFFHLGKNADLRTYVGIWYYKSDPLRYVWVANRDKPLRNSGGFFSILNGTLGVFYANGSSCWTAAESSSSTSLVVLLMDSGNLVLWDDQSAKTLWQSFDHPTDTFLPGMEMNDGMVLSSWKRPDDPGIGDFVFKLDRDTNQFQYIISKGLGHPHWKSGDLHSCSDRLPSLPIAVNSVLSNSAVNSVLSNSSTENGDIYERQILYNRTIVMNYTGQIQYLSDQKLVWSAPIDNCSIFQFCGSYGSCSFQGDNAPICKCLPGFEPASPLKWNSGDVSDGCVRSPISFNETRTFLRFENIRVGKPLISESLDAEKCQQKCVESFRDCKAYSILKDESKLRDANKTCFIWTELNNFQENVSGGCSLYLLVPASKINQTTRDCKACGTNLIPYPLSTGPDCGDPMYSRFLCDNSTGQVSFRALSGTYNVAKIDTDSKKFYIKADDPYNRSCFTVGPSKSLKLAELFSVTEWCSVIPPNGKYYIEITWQPPPEPTCTSSIDCKHWPHSSCQKTDGPKRCLCDSKYSWEGNNLTCIQVNEKSGKMPEHQIVMIALLCLIVVLCSSILYEWRRKIISRKTKEQTVELDSERQLKDLIYSDDFVEEDKKDIDVPFFNLDSILSATSNFSDANKLGQGGFGLVYKAEFEGGREIAVKRLSSVSGQGIKEFRNEVVLIAKLQHRNLVRLLGYCIEGQERILLYEYMPNRSLDSFIFDSRLSVLLDWERRFSIITGIARGVLYLHQDSRLRIIHRDLKTSNILLDEDMNPKISDFGLARIIEGKQTENNTVRVVGTYGYLSPEYALDGIFSVKSDVFSFGVIVLEIISGKKNKGFYQSQQDLTLLGHAWRLWTGDKILDLMDVTISASCNKNEFIKCVNIGLLCVQEDPSDRPSMADVVTLLSGEMASYPTPKQPAFILRSFLSTASSSEKPESSSISETRNKLTITLDVR